MRLHIAAGLALVALSVGCGGPDGKPSDDAGPGSGCVQVTCEQLGKNCDLIPDGCNTGYIDCGKCQQPHMFCGGGGISNVCGCDPHDPECCDPGTDETLCRDAGKNCGQLLVTNRCTSETRTLQCGNCVAPETCGGGHEANVCGCTPLPNDQLCELSHAECGALDLVQCGKPIHVECPGVCPNSQVCGSGGVANVCACPETDLQACTRWHLECGSAVVINTCGEPREVQCGGCSGSRVCAGSRCIDTVCGPAPQLCWSHPLPRGNPLRDIWASSSGGAWAVGDSGVLLHSQGGWHPVASATADLLAVWGSGPNDVWAVGREGVRLHWQGSAWRAITPDATDLDMRAVAGSGEYDVWMIGSKRTTSAESILYHWDGTLWTTYNAPARMSLHGLFALSSTKAWAAGVLDGSAALLEWDGTNWNTVSLTMLNAQTGTTTVPVAVLKAVWGSSTSDLWIAGTQSESSTATGVLAHFDGFLWTPAAAPFAEAPVLRLTGTSSSDVWACGPEGMLIHYNGTAWRSLESATPENIVGIRTVAQVYGSHLFACGDQSGLFEGDGGWNIATLYSSTAERSNLRRLWGSNPYSGDPVRLWAVGDHGMALRFDGSAWSATPTETTANLEAVWGPSANTAWAVGANGTVLQFNGMQWRRAIGVPSTEYLLSVWGSSNGQVWAVGGAGTILLWDGSAWTAFSNPASERENLYAVWAPPTGQRVAWAVGDNGRILHYANGEWTAAESPVLRVTLRGLWGRTSNDIWAVGDDATVIHWDGSVWKKVLINSVVPTTVAFKSVSGSFDASSNKLDLWVTGDYGTILHFDGVTWSDQSARAVTKATIYGAWGAPSQHWAIGANRSVFVRSATSQWQLEPQITSEASSPNALRAVWAASDRVWVADAVGNLRSNIAGDWARVFSPSLVPLNAFWGAAPNDVWVVGNGPASALHWNGTHWLTTDAPIGRPSLEGIWGSAADDVWAVSSDQPRYIYHWNGSGWTTWDNPLDTTLVALWGSSSTDVWAVGSGAAVAHWDGTGTATDSTPVWKSVALPASYTLHSVRGRAGSAGDVWAVGKDAAGGKALNWNGQHWNEMPMPQAATDHELWALCGDATLYAVGGGGNETGGVVLRLDGADGWQLIDEQSANILKGCAVDAQQRIWVVGLGGTILVR